MNTDDAEKVKTGDTLHDTFTGFDFIVDKINKNNGLYIFGGIICGDEPYRTTRRMRRVESKR